MTRQLSGTLAIAACSAALLLVGCTNSGQTKHPVAAHNSAPQSRAQHATSREFFEFTSLAEMVATSSAVVVGTVTAIEPGRVAGSGMDEERYTLAALRVDQQLYGAKAPSDLRLEELTTFAGDPIVLDGVDPSKVGDTGIYFLRRTETGTYVLISSQGRFLKRGSGLDGTNARDPLVSRLQGTSPAELIQRVEEAKTQIASGQVQAKQGPPGLSR